MESILFLIVTIIFSCILGKIASDFTFGKREKPKKSGFIAKYPISQLIYDIRFRDKYGGSPVKVVLITADSKGETHRYSYPIRLAKYKRFYNDEPYIPCLIIEYIGREDQVFCFYIRVNRIPKNEDEDTIDEPKIIDSRDCWYDLKERCFYINNTVVKRNKDNRYSEILQRNADYCFEESTEERKQTPTIYMDNEIVLSRYKKRPIVLEYDTSRIMAFICKKNMVLTNPNGDVHANAGDYIVIDRNGYFNPISKEIFDELYVRADD